MERAYREDELQEATIIDSEGYIYGKVEKVEIEEDEIVLTAYESKPDVKTKADLEGLKTELLNNVKVTLTTKLQRLSPTDVLTRNIRKELGLKLNEPLTDRHFINYAERLGIAIPQTKASIERKEPKGTVSLDEIKAMKISVVERREGTEVIKVILLRKPREATFRKIPIQKTVPYRSTEAIRDKLILDADGTVLGYVDSIVLFQDKLGIRVFSSKKTGQVSLGLLNKYLEETGKPDVATLLRKHFERSRRSYSYTIKKEDLEAFMNEMKLTFRLPEKVMASSNVREFVADIPWNDVYKIGDVVLLKSTLSDLQSKGYFQGS